MAFFVFYQESSRLYIKCFSVICFNISVTILKKKSVNPGFPLFFIWLTLFFPPHLSHFAFFLESIHLNVCFLKIGISLKIHTEFTFSQSVNLCNYTSLSLCCFPNAAFLYVPNIMCLYMLLSFENTFRYHITCIFVYTFKTNW